MSTHRSLSSLSFTVCRSIGWTMTLWYVGNLRPLTGIWKGHAASCCSSSVSSCLATEGKVTWSQQNGTKWVTERTEVGRRREKQTKVWELTECHLIGGSTSLEYINPNQPRIYPSDRHKLPLMIQHMFDIFMLQAMYQIHKDAPYVFGLLICTTTFGVRSGINSASVRWKMYTDLDSVITSTVQVTDTPMNALTCTVPSHRQCHCHPLPCSPPPHAPFPSCLPPCCVHLSPTLPSCLVCSVTSPPCWTRVYVSSETCLPSVSTTRLVFTKNKFNVWLSRML